MYLLYDSNLVLHMWVKHVAVEVVELLRSVATCLAEVEVLEGRQLAHRPRRMLPRRLGG